MAAAAAAGWKKERLWRALLALGFTAPGDEEKLPRNASNSVWKSSSRTVFGTDMFDKPNMEAFQIVVHYLFLQLDQTHANSLFRDCWPIYDKKMAACFRKVCFEWLKKVADEVGNSFPQVVASLFLSPGGPKFINLMYHFAKYVLTNKFNEQAENSTWIPMVVGARQQNLHLTAMKSCIASNRFLEGIQKEAFVVGEYKKREELLVKEYPILRKQYTERKDHLDKGVCGFAEERIQKRKELREMWNIVKSTLSELEKEKEVIDSIVEGRVDLYTLDGTDVTLKVPRPLLIRIENEADQIGDLYKAGKLNLAAIIQLCNWSLRLHGDQHCQVSPAELDHHLSLERLAEFLKNELMEMKEKSQKITREVFPSVKTSVAEMESTWDKKWEQYLSRTGFSPLRKKYPVLDLLPTMPPLSFEPASEEAYKSSVFYSHSATLPGPEEPCTRSSERDDSGIGSLTRSFNEPSTSKLQCSGRFNTLVRDPTEETSCSPLREESIEMPLVNRHPLESRLQTPCANKMGRQQKDKAQSPTLLNKPKESLFKKREEPLQKAVDQLAEEVVDIITKDSPGVSQKQDRALEDILVSLANNPFIAQTELPRTPENLITDIRNSWRCAVQESELEQRKHQDESVSTYSKHKNCTNDQVLLESKESSSVNVENTPPDATALCCAEIGETQESWIVSADRKTLPSVKGRTCYLSENTSNADAESASSNCPSTRNEKRNNQFPKPDCLWEKTKFRSSNSLPNCEGSGIGCSDVGSKAEPLHFSSKTGSDTDDALISKTLSTSSGSQVLDFGEDCVFNFSKSLNRNVTLTDETDSEHSLQFMTLERLSTKSPIKKEKLSKNFIMEMCKNDRTLEISETVSSFDTECDLEYTLPWNESQDFNAALNSSTKPLRFGILEETIPDMLDNDSLNSSKSIDVDQLDDSRLEFKSDVQDLRSRLEQLRQGYLATTMYSGSEKINLIEHMGASDFHSNGDGKNQCKSELHGGIDYVNEEIDHADKLFALESEFLKALSPVSLESQKLGLFPASLSSSPLNGPVLEDDLFGISELNPSKHEEPQRACATICENSSVFQGTFLDNGVEQLINF
ncbi:HAUS augmin-like complex subunit 6 isoform X1 [Heptranchias perlo]|uniref:HAUS augmin-like complex subunit 6 isoform X1 n=1 Tax=Heptranchias perlo TaxID=212740 RepID=UPI00355A932C